MDLTHLNVKGNAKRIIKVVPSIETIASSPLPIAFEIVLEDKGVYGKVGKFSFWNGSSVGNKVEYGGFVESYKQNSDVPKQLIEASIHVFGRIARDNNYHGIGKELMHVTNFERIKNYNPHKLKKIIGHFIKAGYEKLDDMTCSKTYGRLA